MTCSRRRSSAPLLATWLLFAAWPALASAQDAGSPRRIEFHFTPTARTQLALWIESADGTRFATVRLTEAVAVRGIGNRPGATQMNSGYRWPYGRREGVLPIWAHRRVALGAMPFPRVIFNGRLSEGNASSAGSWSEPPNTRDDYFCLSFNQALSGRDALDAVSCASPFMSNKGRYETESDAAAGYAEPWQRPDRTGMMRALDLFSVYPPRRDVVGCCGDHTDVADYAADARAIMPEIDAITMATPMPDLGQLIVFNVPPTWLDGDYVAYLEANVEGDYNAFYNDTSNPTPTEPSTMWDYWARTYGYSYRGQPSVLFRVPFVIRETGGEWYSGDPAGYGALHGEDGDARTMDSSISEDPSGAPGSGVDRLRADGSGQRLRIIVPPWDVCDQPDPPVECGRDCSLDTSVCGARLICGPDGTCVGLCDVQMAPDAMEEPAVTPYPDEKESHHWARVRFRVPPSPRDIARYEVRVGTQPIVDLATFEQALPAVQPRVERIELSVPVEGAAGDIREIDLGGLNPQTTYYVAMRAIDVCNAPGPFAVGEVTTTEIHFTTVSPCFVATAAYGSPMEERVGALRRFRDRHLRTNALGRTIVSAYYALGPYAADAIRDRPLLRSAARGALSPLVALAELTD